MHTPQPLTWTQRQALCCARRWSAAIILTVVVIFGLLYLRGKALWCGHNTIWDYMWDQVQTDMVCCVTHTNTHLMTQEEEISGEAIEGSDDDVSSVND